MAQAATRPTPSLTLQSEPIKLRVRGPWHDAWRRLLRNRAALTALVVILLYVIAATVCQPRLDNRLTAGCSTRWSSV